MGIGAEPGTGTRNVWVFCACGPSFVWIGLAGFGLGLVRASFSATSKYDEKIVIRTSLRILSDLGKVCKYKKALCSK